MHSYAASFSIKKKVFVKLTTFSAAKKTKNETKGMDDSERASKIKVTSPWIFFSSYLHLKSFAWKRGCTISLKVKYHKVC